MLQRDHLLDWRTVEGNVLLGLQVKGMLNEETRAFTNSLLKTYGLSDFAKSYPRQLSGGMRQKVALIRTLACSPELLLLDEHTAALDPKTAAKVMELTDRIVREGQLTTLMITHNMRDAIQYGNRLIMLHDGHVILDIAGEEKKKLTVPDLLEQFTKASGDEFANDRAILS